MVGHDLFPPMSGVCGTHLQAHALKVGGHLRHVQRGVTALLLRLAQHVCVGLQRLQLLQGPLLQYQARWS